MPTSSSDDGQLVPFPATGALTPRLAPQDLVEVSAPLGASRRGPRRPITACALCLRPFEFCSPRRSGPAAAARPFPAIEDYKPGATDDDTEDDDGAPSATKSGSAAGGGSGGDDRAFPTYFETLPAIRSRSPTPPQSPLFGEPSDVRATEAVSDNGYYKAHFQEVSLIGRGGFGSVHLCRHVVGDEVVGIFAVKKIPVGDDARYLHKVLSEVKTMERIGHHPNVVQYHHSWLDVAKTADYGPSVRCLFILMEYAPFGSLDRLVEKHGAELSDDAVWYFFLSVLRGLGHLHKRGVLHRDIKTENVLLAGDVAANGRPRASAPPRPVLADFGTSAEIPDILAPEAEAALLQSRTGATGTEEYMAPELLEQFEASTATTPTGMGPKDMRAAFYGFHTVASDLYATGVLLHRLAFGTLPAGNGGGDDVSSASPAPRPLEMVALIDALTQQDPQHRPTSVEAILSVPEVEAKWAAVSQMDAATLLGKRNDHSHAATPARPLAIPSPSVQRTPAPAAPPAMAQHELAAAEPSVGRSASAASPAREAVDAAGTSTTTTAAVSAKPATTTGNTTAVDTSTLLAVFGLGLVIGTLAARNA